MKTIQEKLKIVPSPIREMIEEAIATTPTIDKARFKLHLGFWFHNNTVFSDVYFWVAVHEEIEYYTENFNKKRIAKSMMNHNINAC